MADVISHTSLLIPCNRHHHHHNRNGGVSAFLSKSPIFLSTTRYPSLKAKLQLFRAPGPVRRSPRPSPPNAQVGIGIGRGQKWWEKGLKPNMREVSSAQDLVDSLLIAGDRLVVVDFFSPGCGSCKALHPKICQLAEMNPDVQFLQVNYEEHKSMCYALNVHVLPFFRLYRGAHGRLCSFSCTNATIKKFKDALAKHAPDRCSLGPAKGLEEKELLALAACKDLSFVYEPLENQKQPQVSVTEKERDEILTAATQPSSLPLPLPLPLPIPSATR